MLRALPSKAATKGTLPPPLARRKARIVKRSRPLAAPQPVACEPEPENYDLANAVMLATALGTGVYIDTFM